MFIYPYRMTSTTTTIVLIDPFKYEVIIGVRSKNAQLYPGYESLPGGFLEAKFNDNMSQSLFKPDITPYFKKCLYEVLDVNETNIKNYEKRHDGENVTDCAIRELNEETSITVTEDQLVLFDTRAFPDTNKHVHVTNICYYVILTQEQIDELQAGDDLESLKRVSINDVLDGTYDVKMAFNHNEIMKNGIEKYQDDNTKLIQKTIISHLRDYNSSLQKELAELKEKYKPEETNYNIRF